MHSGNRKNGHIRKTEMKAWKSLVGLKKIREGIAGAATMLIAWASLGMTAYAKEDTPKKKDPFGFVEGKDNGMFDDLIETVEKTGASANKLMMALGAVSAVLALGGVGLMIMLIKNSNKREENKSWLMAIVAGAMMLFGSASFAGILYQMGQSV